MNRLLPIEGLRAYLAIMVVLGHVMFFSVGSFQDAPDSGFWVKVAKLIVNGPNPVDVFMIISGFVIFFLLDKKRESYGQFIVRRFFRLYPLYIVLLAAALALSPLEWRTFQSAHGFMTAASIDYYTEVSTATWNHWGWNLFLHLGMLHGMVPSAWLGRTASYAFIIAAWSISVEWQFYLLAPILHGASVASQPLYRIGVFAVGTAAYLLVRHMAHFEAFLPLFIPYFFIGIASYFIYKALPSFPPDTAFPVTLGFAIILYSMGARHEGLGAIVFWIPFFGLLCEGQGSYSARLLWPIFNHHAVQYLGAISYGIYLSHELIITLAQAVLVRFAPAHDETTHFVALLALTLAGTILLAALLHRFVEVPNMDLGRLLAGRMKPMDTRDAALPVAKAH